MEKGTRKRSSTAEGKGHENIKCVIIEFEEVLVPSSLISCRDLKSGKLHGHVVSNVEAYLADHFEDEAIKKFVDGLKKKEKSDGQQVIPEGAKDVVVKAVAEHVKALLAKCDTSHKADDLVVPMIKSALDKNEFEIKLFEEVGASLKEWTDKKLKLVVLTNRSQQLVHTVLLSACDGLNEADILVESMGDEPSSVKESYVALAGRCQTNVADILFITHCQNEAVAASAAGMEVVLVKREQAQEADKKTQEAPDKEHPFSIAKGLAEVFKHSEAVVPLKQSRPEQAAECKEKAKAK